MKCSLGVLVVLLAVCSAQVPNFGWCPDYVPMSDFDMERFLGKWYEAERYFQVSELGTRCVVSDYAKAPNGKIFVSNEVTSRITGVKRVLSGDLELIGRGGEGKMKLRYQTSPITTTTTLSVLDTDYDNYSVLWSCSNYGPIYTQNAWVMTRERLPSTAVLQKAYGVLERYRISRTFFQRTEQEGCQIAASEINAAQGWIGDQTAPEVSQSVEKSNSGIILGKSAQPILDEKPQSEEKIPLPENPKLKPEESKLENLKEETHIKKEVKKELEKERLALKENKLDSKKAEKIAEHILKKTEEIKEKPLDNKPDSTETLKSELKKLVNPKVASHHKVVKSQ